MPWTGHVLPSIQACSTGGETIQDIMESGSVIVLEVSFPTLIKAQATVKDYTMFNILN